MNDIFAVDAVTLKFIKANRGACRNIKPELTPAMFIKLSVPLRLGEQEMIQFETIHRRKNGTCYFVEIHLQLTTLIAKQAFVSIFLHVANRKEIGNGLQMLIQGAD